MSSSRRTNGEVVIIGGGLAGISAAVCALDKGLRPIIFEKMNQLGGRVSSLYAKDARKKIDIGQHVLSNSYKETRRLLQKIGTLKKIHFQKRLKINFRLSADSDLLFQSWLLPKPAHFFLPLILNPALPRNDRKIMLKWLRKFRKYSNSALGDSSGAESLKQMTVQEWLNEIGNSDFLQKLIWEPLTIATLNTPIEQASASLLYRAMQKAFLSSYFGSGLGIPLDFLDEIFGKPAHRFIIQSGGSVHLRAEIKRLISDGERIQSLQTQQKQIFETPHLILAVSPHELLRLSADLPGGNEEFSSHLKRFQYAPIITINLWFNKRVNARFPTAFVDSPIQWFFELPEPSDESGPYGYTVVISAAMKLVRHNQQELMKLVQQEFQRFFNRDIHSDWGLAEFKIIKEKRATILQTPETSQWRPDTKTKFSNVYLAGDWVDTGLPATIEGAVLSGKMAVESVVEGKS